MAKAVEVVSCMFAGFMVLAGWVCKEQIEVSLKVVGVFRRLFGCCCIGEDDVVV